MIVLPVVDLMDGVVVSARCGDRASYRPIDTPLASGSDPLEVVRGFLSVYPFGDLYVADLDAIRRLGDNVPALRRLRAEFPRLRLWVDNGPADARDLDALIDNDVAFPIVGTEKLRDTALLATHARRHPIVLSLDFMGDAFQGPEEILAEPSLWPNRVIVMTLSQVGTARGPDFTKLSSILAAAGPRHVFAAGGVRGFEDLAALNRMGVAGALVATALHNRRLSAAEIKTVGAPSLASIR